MFRVENSNQNECRNKPTWINEQNKTKRKIYNVNDNSSDTENNKSQIRNAD